MACLCGVSVAKAASLPVHFYFLLPGFWSGKISPPVPKKKRDTAPFQKYDPLHFPVFPVLLFLLFGVFLFLALPFSCLAA
jgi:quinol-cytochrome oxidoreductase complex cytochrome b subunit